MSSDMRTVTVIHEYRVSPECCGVWLSSRTIHSLVRLSDIYGHTAINGQVTPTSLFQDMLVWRS